MHRPFATVALLFSIVLVIAACQTPAGRSAGQVVDDATITSKVKTKLLHDSLTKGLAVDVDTFQGTVTLTGAVDNAGQREKVGYLAASVRGVKKVNNLISLKK